MLFSSVTPLPDTDLSNVIRVLETQAQSLANLQGTGAYGRLSAYQTWASQASSQLRYVLDLPQVEHLIDTRRHDFLFNMFGGPEGLLNYSISAEQEDRARVFGEALDGLRAAEARCTAMPRALLVPDTNIYLHQDVYFHELNWHEIAETSDEVRLLIPMAVMRELDRAKRTPGSKPVSFTNKEAIRDRARLASKRIRTSFENPDSIPELATKVTTELLMDPRGHRAIEDADSEIIDRALALQTMAGRRVSIVTTDGNMQFGAHVAGLAAILLPG
jgi:rRNA-processing protein FCF1